MRCVNNQVVCFALRNDILKKKVLLSLVDHYISTQLLRKFETAVYEAVRTV